ncbi:oxidoreductase [Mycobacterium paraffinicum]|uniref:Oxidoreductase n=1 Tax=Mycobacterium paraffinicum TaxID=53378 RepID=A0A1Q4I329_9MYCO|nr:oxidoreductase [Mycobacterium paraffinicum]
MGQTNSAAFNFTGTRVLVTGATSGIGHATAMAFAHAGAAVTVTGRRASASGYDVDLDGFEYLQCELGSPESVDAVVGAIDRLDVLVNNAGGAMPGGVREWDPSGFAEAVAVNLTGPMRLTVGLHPMLRDSAAAGGGAVVNVGSMAAFRTTAPFPGYGAAKSGLVMLTMNLARKWAKDGIRVNAIAPGLTLTARSAEAMANPELLKAELRRIPMGRAANPEDITGPILFLCTGAAAYITGATYAVDGGYLTS